MSISLQKGGRISLKKEAAGVTTYYIALGWDEAHGVDPDVTAFLCKADSSGDPILYPNVAGRDQTEVEYGNLVFFNNQVSADGAVRHVFGDSQDGANHEQLKGTAAENDDEAISVDTVKLDAAIDEISFVVTIDSAKQKRQTFQQVRNSFIRICENDGFGREIARFKLDESFGPFTAVQFGSLVRKDGGWEFEAVGQGYGSASNVIEFEAVVAQYTQHATA